MSGYFRGPSLFSHVFFLSLINAIGIPVIADWIDSFIIALWLGLVFSLCYIVAAIIWAASWKR